MSEAAPTFVLGLQTVSCREVETLCWHIHRTHCSHRLQMNKIVDSPDSLGLVHVSPRLWEGPWVHCDIHLSIEELDMRDKRQRWSEWELRGALQGAPLCW